MTADEIFDELCDRLALGHKVIPVGKCPNFDPREGCLCAEVAAGGIS